MRKDQLEHVIRAVGDISKVKEVIVIGSQSIHGQFPDITRKYLQAQENSLKFKFYEPLLGSMEADIIVPENKQKTEIVDVIIGYMSNFHETYGYYVDGVDESTSKLPEGWRERLFQIKNINTNGITGKCLEIHDLIISKLYAGREKDMNFFNSAVNLDLLKEEVLISRLEMTSDLNQDAKQRITESIKYIFNSKYNAKQP